MKDAKVEKSFEFSVKVLRVIRKIRKESKE